MLISTTCDYMTKIRKPHKWTPVYSIHHQLQQTKTVTSDLGL